MACREIIMSRKAKFLFVCSLFIMAGTAVMFPSDYMMADDDSACPAFTPAMVDAGAMALKLYRGVNVTAEDDPTIPSIFCHIEEGVINTFSVEVNYSEPYSAFVWGSGRAEDDPDFDTQLYSDAEQLSLGQMHACRAALRRSFVWKNYCAPALP
jgi:hypothetical protein